ncbi:MAG: hypothetical protein LBE56_01005 [Tannerella sp.]|nr:hypothetical protein [Tannerella sp.]
MICHPHLHVVRRAGTSCGTGRREEFEVAPHPRPLSEREGGGEGEHQAVPS